MLWLFDCRNRLRGKRKLLRFPYTYEGKRQAWNWVLTHEVPSEQGDYHYLRDSKEECGGLDDMHAYCEIFNDYWACYGWCLQSMELDAEIPHDAEVVK